MLHLRTRRTATASILILLSLLSVSCVGVASRVHKDDEPVKDVEASDVDLRAMAREMAAALIELDVISRQKQAVVIAFPTITNRTLALNFDSGNIQSMIRTQLITHSQGKIQFLDSELSNLVYAQRDACRAGTMVCQKRADLPGAAYFLKGHASSDHKVDSGGTMSGSHRYAFRLTDAETGVIVWEKDYEFKKSGRRGPGYR